MKFTTVLVAIFATAVAAGAIEQRSDNKPPKCAKKCIKDSAKVSDCGKKDFACMCSSKPFHQAVVPCIKDECSKPEIEDMAQWVQKTCGFPIDVKKGGQ